MYINLSNEMRCVYNENIIYIEIYRFACKIFNEDYDQILIRIESLSRDSKKKVQCDLINRIMTCNS